MIQVKLACFALIAILQLQLQLYASSIPKVQENMYSLLSSDVDANWKSYKLKYSRSYKNQLEETQRYFISNCLIIS